jgi:hypothetical protein
MRVKREGMGEFGEKTEVDGEQKSNEAQAVGQNIPKSRQASLKTRLPSRKDCFIM